MPEHFREATLYGIFFVFAASVQVVFGLLMLGRPSRPLIAVGLVGNLAVIALWAVSRTWESRSDRLQANPRRWEAST